MRKLLFPLAIALLGVILGGCGPSTPPAEPQAAATATTKGFYYVLDASGRHLRSGHLPHNHQDRNWLLEMKAETTNAQILHIWLNEDFVTVEL